MGKYDKINTLSGWIMFLVASFIYLSTLEPTTSFWDCGEFIAAAFKLEVGHPPGAPFYLLLGRFFSLFAGNNNEQVAIMVNALSGLASAFTIMFLFWTITHLAKKTAKYGSPLSTAQTIAVIGSGVIGALIYSFSDTFWFSAVEGEVYATSSLFTAVVFWAILKWENVADKKYANRWLILIAYLMGLSIGVHLLNLLAIPAIVLIYYFRKYKYSNKGLIKALLIALLILGGIMYIIIPGTVKMAALIERLFVNSFALPANSGVVFTVLLIASVLWYGIHITQKNKKIIANTIILSITVIMIGYSSYALIVIRSLANPPMDQNNPENIYTLTSYLNREQYGERPLLYGQYFNAQGKQKEGKPIYRLVDGQYKIIGKKPDAEYKPKYTGIFPRMYSQQENHIEAYIKWSGLNKSDLYRPIIDQNGQMVRNRKGEIQYDYSKPKSRPSFASNLNFFIKYQIGYMYFRYFMWNYSGRQNDIQGHYKDEITKGNWISGFKFIDAARLGNQEKLPLMVTQNFANNSYYMLPLLLGLIGLVFHFASHRKSFLVVLSLFFFTGIAIVIYLNQPPLQPRERDYAYAGSFYAFAIWIGLSVIALFKTATEKKAGKLIKPLLSLTTLFVLFDLIANHTFSYTPSLLFVSLGSALAIGVFQFMGKYMGRPIVTSTMAAIICLPVPLLMAKENMNDHDRSGRYFARDFALNYLMSSPQNGILFTNGDNDTFPLWYVQEVEEKRTDVRVTNLSYLGAGWYIKQMTQKAYESEPIKLTLKENQYAFNKRNIVYFHADPNDKKHYPLDKAIWFVAQDDPKYKKFGRVKELHDYIPTNQFKIEADSTSVFSNHVVTENIADKYVNEVRFKIDRNYILKNHLIVLDMLSSNLWERPISYAITVSDDNYLGLGNYFMLQGLAYRVSPTYSESSNSNIGGINSKICYDNMINNFRWGGLEKEGIYLDENIRSMLYNMRNNHNMLAKKLIQEQKTDSALKVLDHAQALMPNNKLLHNIYSLDMVKNYYVLDQIEKADRISQDILHFAENELNYYFSLNNTRKKYLEYDLHKNLYTLEELYKIASKNKREALKQRIEKLFHNYQDYLN